MTTDIDPGALSLDDLRATRAGLQREDDAVSYVRRLVQARLDLVRAEQRRRVAGRAPDITGELPVILGAHLTAGQARPPRPADDFSDHPHAREFDALCEEYGSADLESLDSDELASFAGALDAFEQARSAERRDLFARIDALSAELVRRYRVGEADVDGLRVDDLDSDSDAHSDAHSGSDPGSGSDSGSDE